MSILVLTHDEVEALLPMAECIPVMAQALAALARGEVAQPQRINFQPEGAGGTLLVMPAYLGGARPVYGVKTIGVFHGNSALGLDAHQGGVLLHSGETGELLALMNAAAITGLRTAAVSAVATRALAREEAGDLAIIGTGHQARCHLQALGLVRTLRRVRVAARSPESARRFAEEMAAHCPVPIEPMTDVAAAVAGADLLVLATTAHEPVIRREWLAPGAHLNVVGAYKPHVREVDAATMAAAELYVDRRESALSEAGDVVMAIGEGLIGPEHLRGELGEVLIGARPGRSGPDAITLFKAVGLPAEDVAAAAHVYARARERGVGREVDF